MLALGYKLNNYLLKIYVKKINEFLVYQYFESNFYLEHKTAYKILWNEVLPKLI